jgi:hypothetical protein
MAASASKTPFSFKKLLLQKLKIKTRNVYGRFGLKNAVFFQKAFTSKAKNQNKKRVWPLRSQKRRFLSISFYFKS